MTIPGTEGLHPWAQILGVIVFVTMTAILAAWSQHRARREAVRAKEEDKRQATAAMTTAAAVAASTPVASQYNADVLVQTLATLSDTLERLNERLDADERNREMEREAELAYLRRAVGQIRPPS